MHGANIIWHVTVYHCANFEAGHLNNARRINGIQVANCGVEGHDRLISSYLNYESALVEKDCLFTIIIFMDNT